MIFLIGLAWAFRHTEIITSSASGRPIFLEQVGSGAEVIFLVSKYFGLKELVSRCC